MVSRGWGTKIEGLVARGTDLPVKKVIRVVLVLFSCLLSVVYGAGGSDWVRRVWLAVEVSGGGIWC
jgi:hypothetical protein